jgi:hypothetical protein
MTRLRLPPETLGDAFGRERGNDHRLIPELLQHLDPGYHGIVTALAAIP